jgi:hypothetical protein
LIGQIVSLNTDGGDARSLVQRVVEADDTMMQDWRDRDSEHFGSDLAMIARGHGVRWFDDLTLFPLKRPLTAVPGGWPEDASDPFYKNFVVKPAYLSDGDGQALGIIVVPANWDKERTIKQLEAFSVFEGTAETVGF